ncbi:Methyltransferase domain-containing protein [Nocardioides scoriae]|uniref:Methyltransferase domain-containing protein n=1 Tax=Nocardioides scoriae TaxID=642780 RepID=A0A1H1MWW7_9ACTN|nr:class I SAM-dependent methyltransferase [Nocardioides scoriae]SDR91246.1 Methyltransferase domain-containing protein [Nocardioides scoriae]
MGDFRRRVASSRFARAAALPTRIRVVGRHDLGVLTDSARWLTRSREHTNFTYDLQPLNREHLSWWVAGVADVPVDEVRSYVRELEEDDDLVRHVRTMTQESDRRGLADSEVRFGRRLGWYALVRATRPNHVVETGTDKGLGSVVLAAALLRNGTGRLTTIDVNAESGYLVTDRYAGVVERRLGDSLALLGEESSPVDLFLHDSLHTRAHELAELAAVEPRLAPGALVLSDNAHATDALMTWAEQRGRSFSYWQERPDRHWYPGCGIGLAR